MDRQDRASGPNGFGRTSPESRDCSTRAHPGMDRCRDSNRLAAALSRGRNRPDDHAARVRSLGCAGRLDDAGDRRRLPGEHFVVDARADTGQVYHQPQRGAVRLSRSLGQRRASVQDPTPADNTKQRGAANRADDRCRSWPSARGRDWTDKTVRGGCSPRGGPEGRRDAATAGRERRHDAHNPRSRRPRGASGHRAARQCACIRIHPPERVPRRSKSFRQQWDADVVFLAPLDSIGRRDAGEYARGDGPPRQRDEVSEPGSRARNVDALDSYRRCIRDNARSGGRVAYTGIPGRLRARDRTGPRNIFCVPRANAVRSIALGAALLLATAQAARAQLVPNDDWRTITTPHFRVHFTPPLEEQARRAAVNAERAYAQLSAELEPPRGTIDLVISDNVDYVNGYATPFPSNRIVVFAHPPTDASGLRRYDDWNRLVVLHELAHIFHLDRSRGIWRLGQAIFGRNPLLFPNLYQPSWVIEGLAVYFESRLTGYGRLESSEHSMIARASALANRLPRLHELSPGTSRFPGGAVVYVYGSLLFDYLSRTRGPASVRDFVERGSKTPLPFFLTPTSRGAFGISFESAWRQWRDSLVREMSAPREVMPGWEQLTHAGRVALFPR